MVRRISVDRCPTAGVVVKSFKGSKSRLVRHFFASFYPITEIEPLILDASGQFELLENGVSAQRASFLVRFKEGVHGRQTIRDVIGNRDCEQSAADSEFGNECLDIRSS